jgi:hypothetical protein
MSLTQTEIDYLASQLLGRLTTRAAISRVLQRWSVCGRLVGGRQVLAGQEAGYLAAPHREG